MKRTLLLLFTCLMLLSWPQRAMAELQTAVFAGGCFWCMEHDLEHLPGVRDAVSGYSGGQLERPTYRQVSSETTGHQEAVQVRFDPNQISYAELLRSYWRNVDPLDGGGQFCDRGDSYRPVIFTADDAQAQAAEASAVAAARELGQPPVCFEGGAPAGGSLLARRGIPPELRGEQRRQIQLLPVQLRS